jgi:hypothetical protein
MGQPVGNKSSAREKLAQFLKRIFLCLNRNLSLDFVIANFNS